MHLVCQGRAHGEKTLLLSCRCSLLYWRNPILSLAGSWNRDWTSSNPAAHLDTLRIMITEGQYDPMEEADYTSVMHSFNGSPTVYRWLLDQEEFLIDFEQIAINVETIAAALVSSGQSNASEFLEAVIARGIDLHDPAGSAYLGHGYTLAHRAIRYLTDLADDLDFPKRIKVLWDAGADFHTPQIDNYFGTALDYLIGFATRVVDYNDTDYKSSRVEPISTPSLASAEVVIVYDRLEDTSAIKSRSRVPKSLWRSWHPGNGLSILEIVQRHLDAWMEVLLEARLDLVDYGCREDRLHPEGLVNIDFYGNCIEARVYFEYGDHVSGCRIHVTEIWTYEIDTFDSSTYDSDMTDSNEEEVTSAEISSMPCSWNFNDA